MENNMSVVDAAEGLIVGGLFGFIIITLCYAVSIGLFEMWRLGYFG